MQIFDTLGSTSQRFIGDERKQEDTHKQNERVRFGDSICDVLVSGTPHARLNMLILASPPSPISPPLQECHCLVWPSAAAQNPQ